MHKLIISFIVLIISFSALAQDETTLSQINFRGERAYKNGTAFTGILYSDKTANNTCNCTLEANYNNGYLQGTKKEWYSNGKLKFVGNYKNGKLIGTAQKYDSNGNLIREKLGITEEEIVHYVLKAFKPDNYTNQFLKKYLYEFDSNYENYRNNEFEVNRKLTSLKSTIDQKINSVNYSKTYNVKGQVTISKYSFENQSYKLSNSYDGFFLNYATKGFYLFSRTQMKSNNKNISDTYLRVQPINKNDYLEFEMSPANAEKLKNKLNSKLIYYSYDFQILNVTSNEILANNNPRYNYSPGIPAYISIMRLYSDKDRTNLLHTIYPKSSYSNILNNYKSKHINSKTNSTNKISNNSKSNSTINNSSSSRVNTSNSTVNSTKVDNLLKKAESGDRYAQNEIGTYYFNGKSGFGTSHYPFEKDIQKAKYWFKKAAEQGFATSQENLGAIYFEEKDFNNALIWYTKAANSNHSRAQYVLGFMYRKGLGIKKSRKKAKFWWKKSCSLGYTQSCEEVKKMNALGNAILNSVNESLNKRN
ncbi:MAG: SEL1-like repeat protein [Bacteroidetes bacterium]|nr:SEL1-like repeat protein [Bacteroidota bacterium]